jgi:hypothetical protein
MLRNDPSVPPEVRQQFEMLANNPAMLDSLTQRFQDPAMRSQIEAAMASGAAASRGGMGIGPAWNQMMNSGGGAGGGGGGGGVPSNTNTSSSSANNGVNDQEQTEEEMIAEAIRRSLEEN